MTVLKLSLALLTLATQPALADAGLPCKQAFVESLKAHHEELTVDDISEASRETALYIAGGLLSGGEAIKDAIENKGASAYRYGHFLLAGVNKTDGTCDVMAVEYTD
jgi:hypothetical protein